MIFLGISILAFCALPLLVGVDIPSSDMTLPLLIREYLHPLLGGLWGIISGAVMAIVWYVLGYIQFHSLSAWPAVIGSIVSLIVCIVVSKFTPKSSEAEPEVFFNEQD